MRLWLIHSNYAGDERICWRPSLLLIAISVVAWLTLTITIVCNEMTNRSGTYQLQAWDPNGLDYQIEVRVEGHGFRDQRTFRATKTECRMSCQVVHLPDRTLGESHLVKRFLGNRQVVIQAPDGVEKTLTLEWGYRAPTASKDGWDCWDPAGRFISLNYGRDEPWLDQIEPGAHSAPRRIWPLVSRSALTAMIPLLLGWVLIGFIAAFVVESRMRNRHVTCPVCGYDLRGQVQKGCPECGWNRA